MKKLISVLMTISVIFTMTVAFDATVSAATVKATTITGLTNYTTGIRISWKRVSNAQKYKVLRKSYGAKNYSTIKYLSGKSSVFADKKVSAGKTYAYKIVAVNGKNTATSQAKKIVRLTTPTKLTSKFFINSNEDSVVQLTWGRVANAKKYEVYRKLSGGYKKVATVSSTKFNDLVDDSYDDLQFKTLCYRVRAVNGNYKSAYSAVKAQRIVKPVYLLMGSPLVNGVKLTWMDEKVNGITSYDIYRSVNNGRYTKIKSVSPSKSEYLDTSAKEGYTYKYYIITKYGKYYSPKSMVTAGKYEPIATVNVKVGETSNSFMETLEKELKAELGNAEDLNNIIGSMLTSMIKINPVDKTIATVTSDLKIKGLAEGKTKASVKMSMPSFDINEEIGYIVINVKGA